jgi:hypothetical protein
MKSEFGKVVRAFLPAEVVAEGTAQAVLHFFEEQHGRFCEAAKFCLKFFCPLSTKTQHTDSDYFRTVINPQKMHDDGQIP